MRRLFLSALLIPIFLSLVPACSSERYVETIEVAFAPPPAGTLTAAEAQAAMLASYRRFGDLQVVTVAGDFDRLVAVQHCGLWQELGRREQLDPRHCSMFEFRAPDGRRILGRNFDNKATELLVAYCVPDSGYASVGFVPLRELGFDETTPFDPGNELQRRRLLWAPVATCDGINERGVCVSLASLGRRPVTQDPDKASRFLLHLVREILDHAGSVDEATAIAGRYNVFDNGREVISHHIFIGDPHGSVVLEWREGVMQVVPADAGGATQIVTNSPLAGVDEDGRRDQCGRYRVLRRRLEEMSGREAGREGAPGSPLWQQGLDALAAAAQRKATYWIDGERWRVNTEWSAVFDLDASRDVYICLRRQWGRVYRVAWPDGSG